MSIFQIREDEKKAFMEMVTKKAETQERESEHKCKTFGCGKTLTLRERLFGKYCIKHQGRHEQNTV